MSKKIPLRPSLLKRRRESAKWVILHHTSEIYKDPAARIDNEKFQTRNLYTGVLERKDIDVNYNFVIEKIKDDYNVIVARPFVYLCEWEDIDPSINNRAIHVALMGNYDFKIPPVRLYEILAYRIINPLIRMFNLSPKRIKFHRDVSSNKELSCPGDFVDEGRLISQVRRFIVK